MINTPYERRFVHAALQQLGRTSDETLLIPRLRSFNQRIVSLIKLTEGLVNSSRSDLSIPTRRMQGHVAPRSRQVTVGTLPNLLVSLRFNLRTRLD